MTKTGVRTSPEELARLWQQRCQKGSFSSAVLGVGTIRAFGRSGDEPVTFPRITDLSALATLEPDEQWAVNYAQAIVTQRKTPVYAVTPGADGQQPTSKRVEVFDPSAELLMAVGAVRGG